MARKNLLEGKIKQLEEMIHERDIKIIELTEKLAIEQKELKSRRKDKFDGV